MGSRTSAPSPRTSSSMPSRRRRKDRTDGHQPAQRLHRRNPRAAQSLRRTPAAGVLRLHRRGGLAPDPPRPPLLCGHAARAHPPGHGRRYARGPVHLPPRRDRPRRLGHPHRLRHRPVLRLRLRPGQDAARQRSAQATGWTKTFLLGATSGIAGVCAGPILGAVLTLAATEGSFVLGGIMLAVYGTGMVVPLFIIAALWTRVGTRSRSILRGGSVSFLGRRLPIVSMVTGVLMIAVGIVFWATNGLVSAPSLVPTTTLAHAQEWVSSWSST